MSQKFKTEDGLNVHKKLHEGKQPYICEVCEKRFSWASNFKRHSLIHRGEKPFKCEYCGQSFGAKCDMKTHITHVHNNFKAKESSVTYVN